MANNHPFGIGDSAEQSDNLRVQEALTFAIQCEMAAKTGGLSAIATAMFARLRATSLLNRYERTWGDFVPNQAAQPVE